MKKTKSLQRKILILLAVLVLPMNIISVMITNVMLQDARKSVMNSIHATVKTYAEQMGRMAYNTDYLLYYIPNGNTDGVRMFTKKDETTYYLAKDAVTSYLIKYASNVSIADVFYFYKKDLDDFTIFSDHSTKYREYLEENYFFVNAPMGYVKWHLDQIDGEWYLIRNLQEGDMYYGVMMNLSQQMEDIEDALGYPVKELLFSAKKPDTGNALISQMKCERMGIYVTLLFESSVLTQNISMGRWILIACLMLYVALAPLLYRYIRKWVILPLKELNAAHLELEQGKEEYRIVKEADSEEFQEAYHSFNDMAEGLQNLRLENINKELAYKQMLLDNLQLQIRPHFLLNCFNLLYTMVQTQKTEGAQKMILYISQYFRYLFKYNRSLEIFSKEFELIQRYLEVSEYQYPGEFTFQYEFDPEIELVRVPPLMLHNFIENILSHALVHGRVVHIMFSGFYEDGIVTFQIADDGCGISEEAKNQINSGEYADYERGHHVGLRNSIKRLKYFYHDQGTVYVDSTEGEGTVFTICFPYDLEEEEGL